MRKKKHLAYLATIFTIVATSSILQGCSNKKEETVDIVSESFENGMTTSDLDKFVEQMLTLDEKYYDENERKDVSVDFDAEEEQYISDFCSYVNTDNEEAREIYLERLANNKYGRESLQGKFYGLGLYLNQDGEVVKSHNDNDIVDEIKMLCKIKAEIKADDYYKEYGHEPCEQEEANHHSSRFEDSKLYITTFGAKYYKGNGEEYWHDTSETAYINSYNNSFIKVMAAIFGDLNLEETRIFCTGLEKEDFDVLGKGSIIEIVGEKDIVTKYKDDISAADEYYGFYDVSYSGENIAVVHNLEYIENISQNMIEEALKMIKSNLGYENSKIRVSEDGTWVVCVDGVPVDMVTGEEKRLCDVIGGYQQYLSDIQTGKTVVTVDGLHDNLLNLDKVIGEYKVLINAQNVKTYSR